MAKKINAFKKFSAATTNPDLIAEAVRKVYTDEINQYERSSIKARIGESVSQHEIAALGAQLAQFQGYKEFTESTGNLGALGRVPEIATEVIVAANAESIIPLLASTQPIEEEHSIVYFKNVVAQKGLQGYTDGQVISDPLTRDNPGTGFAGAQRFKKTLGKFTTSQNSVTTNITELPVRPMTFEVFVPGIGQGRDDGNGKLVAFGLEGTIDYATGAVTVTLGTGATVSADTDIQAIYDVDVDSAKELPKVQTKLTTKDVKAEIYALSSDVGAFASFAFQKRFGEGSQIEAAMDLTNELTRIMNTRTIVELQGHAPAVSADTTWYRKPQAGVADADHKLSFIDVVAGAENAIHKASGANGVNRMVVGSSAAKVLRGLPDFVADENATRNSVGIYGYYDNIPVIRATGVLGDEDVVFVNNGNGSYFNAPLVYAPYMPLMMTNTVQSVDNPFRSAQAAGIWSAFTSVNPNLTVAGKIKNEKDPQA